jgi:hypothetical protein|eukprot:TRINITY_DN1394_c2_g1_i2.p1 TRINITY_DN1394_c2_g1~~TRINITY_DN1394_c2_g1_i2.p1  ORF type:complete len:353 (+),score=67.61 TRINITY_DN1394_c2_g1_i2:82-1140(+)
MAADPMEILFVAVRGMSVSQLLVVLGAMFSRWNFWTAAGSKEVGTIVGKCMLPTFVFLEFAKPESRDKLKKVFAASEGPLLVGLSAGLMLTYLLIGVVMVKLLSSSSKGVQRAGNVISISVAFGNATALPVMLIGTIEHLFAPGDRVFLYLCVMVYGTINRALMYTAGSAICCGKAKPSLLLNEVNVASVLGLIVCFSGDLFGIDLLSYLHHHGNWLDIAGTGKAIAIMANPMLQMVSGASLSKGPKSEDLDTTAIMASSIARLVICAPVCFLALAMTGVTGSDSSSMKVLGFVLLMESCMPAASQLSLIAIDSGVQGALQNMSTLLFYHSVLCPITCTAVIAVALSLFSTA